MSKPELALWAKTDGTGRSYKHPFRTRLDEGGKATPLTSPSVTTVLGLVDKPALSQWAADMTLNWAIENASLLFVKDQESARRWGRYRWTDVRDERAEVGTGIHETIEALHTNSWNFPVLDDEQNRIMQQWNLLNERYEITPHLSEFTVWSGQDTSDQDYAGTADGLWDITDTHTGESYENVVVDIKTSKGIWPEHWLQLAALQTAGTIMHKNEDGTWREEPLPPSDGTAIIHLREDKHQVLIETDYDLTEMRRQQFMAYRSVWHTKKQVEQFVKDRQKTQEMQF